MKLTLTISSILIMLWAIFDVRQLFAGHEPETAFLLMGGNFLYCLFFGLCAVLSIFPVFIRGAAFALCLLNFLLIG